MLMITKPKLTPIGIAMKGLSLIFFILITHVVLYAQVNVELKDRVRFPEVYFWKHLHDTILYANQGFNFSNYASVKFRIGKKGAINNIEFSTYTDSLVMSHIYNVLMSTNQKWVIIRKWRVVKEEATILLPIIFFFKSEKARMGPTKDDVFSDHGPMDVVGQGQRLFHFSKDRNDNFEIFKRTGQKFEGIALNPVEVIVPLNPTVDKY
jgi:hypothetical protein